MSHKLSEYRLVKKILNGDSQAFEEIINMTEGLVMGIIIRMIPNKSDRLDISQDIYLKAFGSLASFKFNSKLSTWIGAIAYNTCISYLKKRKLYSDEISLVYLPSDMSDSEIHEQDRRKILHQEIEKLPPIYKTLITLFHHQEMSYKEIEEITNLPIGTVKNYLYRARKKLKDNLLLKYKIEDL